MTVFCKSECSDTKTTQLVLNFNTNTESTTLSSCNKSTVDLSFCNPSFDYTCNSNFGPSDKIALVTVAISECSNNNWNQSINKIHNYCKNTADGFCNIKVPTSKHYQSKVAVTITTDCGWCNTTRPNSRVRYKQTITVHPSVIVRVINLNRSSNYYNKKMGDC